MNGEKAFCFSRLEVREGDLRTEILKGRCALDARGRPSHGKYIFCEVCPVTLATFTEGNGRSIELIT